MTPAVEDLGRLLSGEVLLTLVSLRRGTLVVLLGSLLKLTLLHGTELTLNCGPASLAKMVLLLSLL